MNYCVGCKLTSPPGALFCPSCGKGFGYTCQCGARNDPTAKFCAACGRANSVEVTRYVPLGWVGKCVKTAGLVGCAALLLTHFGLVAATAYCWLSRATDVVLFDRTVMRVSDMAFAWIVTILAWFFAV